MTLHGQQCRIIALFFQRTQRTARFPQRPTDAAFVVIINGVSPAATTETARTSRKGTKPVILYLHGRNGNAAEDCRKWAKVATQFGWVLCPQGPGDSGGGGRTWMNSAQAGKAVMDASLSALRAKHKGRVQRYGNILVGFSEGAFVAMQAGLQDQKTWSRWLILAASDRYWVGDAPSSLTGGSGGGKLQRVYLLTGETDGVAEFKVDQILGPKVVGDAWGFGGNHRRAA